jgi:hypothetical protein
MTLDPHGRRPFGLVIVDNPRWHNFAERSARAPSSGALHRLLHIALRQNCFDPFEPTIRDRT